MRFLPLLHAVLASALALAFDVTSSFGQTDVPVPRPGLYKGTMVVSSDKYADQDVPVKSSGQVTARVTPDATDRTKVSVIIRAKPQLGTVQPLREFLLRYYAPTESYVLQELDANGDPQGSGGITVIPGTRRIRISKDASQDAPGAVSSRFHCSILLTRVRD